MSSVYHARRPWSPERPEVLVVCCSDGRWHAHVEEFVKHEVSERADLYAVPGGPAHFDPWNSTFDEARVLEEAMRLFVRYHDLRAVWLIAHEGCAYYRVRHPHLEEPAILERQHADLRRARALLLERYRDLEVRTVFAALADGRVVFTTLESDGTHGGARDG